MKSIHIGKHVKIGQNCSIGACTIEDHVEIARGVTIEDGCVIGKNATIKAGCVLGKGAKIGPSVVLGLGVIVCEKAKIPAKKKVRAGTVVRK